MGYMFAGCTSLRNVEMPVIVEPFGEAQGGIAGECAHFDDVFRALHLDEHLEQSALQVSACHASVEQSHISVAVEAVEIFRFGIGVTAHVVVECGFAV